MRVVIIGGTGHIGTYLVPRLVEDGHEVINVSRRRREPYQPHGAWKSVRHVEMDRAVLEAQGQFGECIGRLQPDIVIDLICFTLASAQQLAEALRGQVQHFLQCGTIWVHGPSVRVPTTEDVPRRPFGEYGIQKAQIEKYLLEEARRGRLPATVLHPGHIVGPGWEPLNPAGHFNPEVFSRLARGEEVRLPNLGMETVHHVHADDVAQAFQQAIRHWNASVGESFHIVSPAAVTLRGYAEAVAGWFGREANLRYLPWEEWRKTVSPQEAQATWDHIAHSPNCSIAKAERLIGYTPRYESLQAVREAVDWLVAHGVIQVDG
ncbi:NAD-dependent epimerase/dehydratase family protein [Alicyclobacillus shizuokensis]|uniref:NAD-dependent epimerase/dehydratase family protein n=1 Tax=Alicyclobacillus shizuokensis TaxID=392014 RepID=UPI0008376F79|nr:NAD-dependent epimerase/dehydratase family protein [Alicyclobacillus shizuokensis]MCL6625329.1 NAD-dependent epimerase/dehydratase family protein [Alicyclobacillus shizuokensis]